MYFSVDFSLPQVFPSSRHVSNHPPPAATRLRAALADFGSLDSERAALLAQLTAHARECVLAAHRTQATTVGMKMKYAFDRAFAHEPDSGLPRRWRRGDDPRKAFAEARPRGAAVLKLFTAFRLETSAAGDDADADAEAAARAADDDRKETAPPPVVISESQQQALLSEFDREIAHALKEVEWKQEKMNESHVPWWLFVVLVVLGWNELMAVLTNPLLLLMLLTVGGFLAFTQLEALEDSQFGWLVTMVKKFVLSQMKQGGGDGGDAATSAAASASAAPTLARTKSRAPKAD